MDTKKIIKFINYMNKLKDIKRTGWVERGVRDPESVADHSYMVALLCMVLPAKGINRIKAMKMALFHDIMEVEVGDIVPYEYWKGGGTMPQNKQLKIEERAMKKILSCLEDDVAKEVLGLWKEFEAQKTPEAKFAKSVDHLERMVQAKKYHDSGNYKQDLTGFWDDNAIGWIKDKKIKKLVLDILGKS
jgi:putative hydrolase of HD superfamily